jgi:hypothetical protein
VLLLAAAGHTVASSSPTAAQTAGPGLSVSPDKVEVDLANRAVDLSFSISATGTDAVAVVLSISDLTHDLDGTPQFPDNPTPSLHVDPSRVTLVPGSPATVRVTGSIPDGKTAFYGGLVAALEKPATGGVDVVTRIGVPLLLRGPQPWHPAATIEDLTLPATATGQPARVEAVIRDTGDVHIRPTGTFSIAKDGQVVGTAALHGEAILPGLARRLGVSWSPPDGLKGPLTVRLDLDDPVATGQRDGLEFPPSAPAASAQSNSGTAASDQSQQPLGGTGSSGSKSDAGRIIAGLVALGLIIAVAIAAALHSRRSGPGAQRRRPP